MQLFWEVEDKPTVPSLSTSRLSLRQRSLVSSCEVSQPLGSRAEDTEVGPALEGNGFEHG